MSWHDDARAKGVWRGAAVVIAGAGLSGSAAARVLTDLGADVTLVDARLGNDGELPTAADLVVTSPGWAPLHPLLVAAAARDVPVWGDVELAWRLRDPAVAWLGVTGTNGKTTTVRMLASMLAAAGHRTVAAGNVGLPLLDAVLPGSPYDVIAVELSSYQLHWTSTVACAAAAILNVAPDHLDWHGSFDAYAADKARIWAPGTVAVANADDASTRALSAGRAQVSFTLGHPGPGQLGVRDGWLVDATGIDLGSAVRLAPVDAVRPAAPHNVANALAAAALARTHGVEPAAVEAGLRAFVPDAHRIAAVGIVAGVAYVDDSKATNAHAAEASIASFDHVVWVAGGLAKGARFDELVVSAASRLRGVVLMGRDRALIGDAVARHAPDVPVVDVSTSDTGAMDDVVRAAAGLARPGDTVLLAPACASMDMFTNYGERGDAFAAAVARLRP
ncbi:MAG: UDP-N-acetylmuramoylalanine--D-glutamate ligase [Actinomycetota bacterium]|jgi:UDP-N-acetylmuramoylalanine--D-glutamate ligase|nr:UDP-N-acetylmuramoylalanine--D-glutamate ligase [Actinomycetota bacterium]